jgi:hypothetical protein
MAKEKQSSNNEQVKEYFKNENSKTIVYQTSDGFLFEQQKHAFDHANSLDESQREVKTLKSASHVEVETDEVIE